MCATRVIEITAKQCHVRIQFETDFRQIIIFLAGQLALPNCQSGTQGKQIYISKSEFDKSKCALTVAFLHCPRGKSILSVAYKADARASIATTESQARFVWEMQIRKICKRSIRTTNQRLLCRIWKIAKKCKKIAKHWSEQRIDHCCVEFLSFQHQPAIEMWAWCQKKSLHRWILPP